MLVKITTEVYKANDFTNDTRWVMNFNKMMFVEGNKEKATLLMTDLNNFRYHIVSAG